MEITILASTGSNLSGPISLMFIVGLRLEFKLPPFISFKTGSILSCLHRGLSKFRSYSFGGHCKTEARMSELA